MCRASIIDILQLVKRKDAFYIVTFIVAVLMLGLIGVQAYWARNAYQLAQAQYRERINKSLQAAAVYANDLAFSFYLYGRMYIQPGEGVTMLKMNYTTQKVTDTTALFNTFPYYNEAHDTCFYSTKVSYYDRLTMVDVAMKFTYRDTGVVPDALSKNKAFQQLTLSNYRQTLDDTAHITRRIDIAKLDSVLLSALRENNITGDYVFGLKKKGETSYQYATGIIPKEEPVYMVDIFNDAPYTTPFQLVLYMRDKSNFVSKTLMAALATSFLVIALLMLGFAYFVRTVLRQKRLSEMKTDFINNMTHEFMTPVTNISLALETLEKRYDPEVLTIIGAENLLLKDNINKVLQLATLERGSYQLDMSELDIHSLLLRVAKNFGPQLQAKGGKVSFRLNARYTLVYGDETHIINLLYNIVDNAIKYSGERQPDITIATSNEKDCIRVVIADKGIGMTEDVRKMVFERFFRGQKGNRHDVKGFGLGLAYVQNIARAHNIRLDVQSRPGIGTSFYLWFVNIKQ